jgi:hypothetical protein
MTSGCRRISRAIRYALHRWLPQSRRALCVAPRCRRPPVPLPQSASASFVVASMCRSWKDVDERVRRVAAQSHAELVSGALLEALDVSASLGARVRATIANYHGDTHVVIVRRRGRSPRA